MELSESTENYLKAIFIILQNQKVVRSKDIMNFFGYKVSSVNAGIKNLNNLGLIKHEKYGYIELTEEGEKLANKVYEKHQTIANFLHNVLCVSEETAYKDACKIEHAISEESYNLLVRFCGIIENLDKDDPLYSTIRSCNMLRDK